MQALYAASMAPGTTSEELFKSYKDSCQHSYKLLLYTLNLLMHTASYALKEEEMRSAKLLSTDEDKMYKGILYNNPLMQSLIKNKYLRAEIDKHNTGYIRDEDILKRVYADFSKQEQYVAYWRDGGDHLEMLLFFLKSCIGHPLFEELLDEFNPAWSDDKSLIIGSLKKILKALPQDGPFMDEYIPDVVLVEEFGNQMLLNVWKKNDELTTNIGYSLNNWEASRVATIDLILLKMAVCEFLYFPTIPTKVTLNEFVEIAKQYSTDKSKEFVNGVLDRLMKDLEKAGKIKKSGRGLVE